jgi:O-antigen/teichoic acid export membrane protein
LRPAIWALSDQAVVSGGNFLTNIAIARLTNRDTYGSFALYLAAILFINSLHSALVVYPLSIGIPKEALPERQGAIVTSSLFITSAGCGILAVGTIPFLSRFAGMQVSVLALCALFAWQAQETCRRALMATLNFSSALLGDFVSYPGQAILIYALARNHHRPTLQTIFACMICTSFAALAIQLIQIRPSLSIRNFFKTATESWHLGRWVVAGALLRATSTQGCVGVLGLRFGAPSVAAWQSIVNIVGLTHPVIFGISNAVVPGVAHINGRSGPRSASRAGIKMGLHGALFLVPYLLGVLCFPTHALTLFYGKHSSYLSLGGPLRLMCCGYLLLYVGSLVSSVLNGMGQPRLSFHGQRISAIVSIAIGLPLAALLGVPGAAAALLLANGAQATSVVASLERLVRQGSPSEDAQ